MVEVGQTVGRAVQEENFARSARDIGGFLDGAEIAGRGEENFGAAVAHQRGDLFWFVSGVKRDSNGAQAENSQVSGAPMGIVVGQQGAAVARLDAARSQPPGDLLCHAAQIAVGEGVEAVAALHLDRGVSAEALLRGREAVVEVFHHCRNRGTLSGNRLLLRFCQGGEAVSASAEAGDAARPGRRRSRAAAVGPGEWVSGE